MPKVSVVMATYNRAHYLKESVQSVTSQTFKDWELIIVDDGSTDSTRHVVSALAAQDARIRYRYQENQGLSCTRAKAFYDARGEYLAFLDDDDCFYPMKLAKQVRFLDENPDIGFVYSYVEMISEENESLGFWPVQPARDFISLARECTVQPNSVLVRRECFERLGTFNPFFDGCDDYEMWLRISKHYPIAFLPECAGVYRRHAENMGKNMSRRRKDVMAIYDEMLKQGLAVLERRAVKRAAAAPAYYQAVTAFDQGNYSEAASLFCKAVSCDPVIGLKISWSRFKNPVYRVVRSYFAVIYCVFRSFTERRSSVAS